VTQLRAEASQSDDCHGHKQPAPEQTCRQNDAAYLPSSAAKLSADDASAQLFTLASKDPSALFRSASFLIINQSLTSDPPLIFLHSKLRI
jgi:hypothetical protein